jgi:hypothetical protein
VPSPWRSRPQNAGKDLVVRECIPLRSSVLPRLFFEVSAYLLSDVVVPLGASRDRLARRAGRFLSRSLFTP